jgi:hypothetical protein
MISITGGIFRLGPIKVNGDALSENMGSKRKVVPSISNKIVACPIQVK